MRVFYEPTMWQAQNLASALALSAAGPTNTSVRQAGTVMESNSAKTHAWKASFVRVRDECRAAGLTNKAAPGVAMASPAGNGRSVWPFSQTPAKVTNAVFASATEPCQGWICCPTIHTCTLGSARSSPSPGLQVSEPRLSHSLGSLDTQRPRSFANLRPGGLYGPHPEPQCLGRGVHLHCRQPATRL